jgi:S1-C subfamily serine protease
MYGKRAKKKRYGILLAIIAATILIIGMLFKPRQIDHTSPESSRVEALRQDVNTLRELAQRNTLRTTSSRFSSMARDDAHFLYPSSDGRTALLWSSKTLLLDRATLSSDGMRISENGKVLPATSTVWGVGLPFTLYQATALDAAPPNTLKVEDLEPGTWMIVDTLGSNGLEFVTGMYSGTSKTTCDGEDYDTILLNAPFDPRFDGSGMFGIDGNLVAVLAQCDHGIAALPVDQIAARIADLGRPAKAPFAHLGFFAEPLAAPFDTLLHASTGLLVTDVWVRWPAALAGLMPGDLILSIDNTPASTLPQLASAAANLPMQLRVQHINATLQTLILKSEQVRPQVEFEPGAGPLALASVSASLAVASGLRAGDQVLLLNGRPASPSVLTQILISGAPADPTPVLTVQRGSRQFLAVVTR